MEFWRSKFFLILKFILLNKIKLLSDNYFMARTYKFVFPDGSYIKTFFEDYEIDESK